jgi:AmmeMemoRadiSam system protein A
VPLSEVTEMTDLDSRTTIKTPARAEDDPHAGPILLGIARSAIASRGSAVVVGLDDPAWLCEPGATFVTITQDGALRGCIGSVDPVRPLRQDVVQNACAAAFHDPRFRPLRAQDVPAVRIEVSLLSATTPLPATSRQELIEHLHPHVDGLILNWFGHRATFLPQVWEQLADPAEFVEHLLHKAGLPIGFWSPDMCARRFGVTAWHEPHDLKLSRTP